MVFRAHRLALKFRLPIEIAALVALIVLSAMERRPYFYRSEELRCRELARIASTAWAREQETRQALDREADWFASLAAALRWRGFWIGLTRVPRIWDEGMRGDTISVYELGMLESVERHEKSMLRLVDLGSIPEE